jgi:NTP pyrophosphatase (non-canonical NTP hydrolase)
MTNDEMIAFVRSKLPDDELLCQLAEEAAELAQAALKYRRVLKQNNPTPVDEETALRNLAEEVADTINCVECLNMNKGIVGGAVEAFKSDKRRRWVKRLGGEP